MSLRTTRAFSFIEVLIGVVILAFGLIPLLWALSGGTRQTGVTLRQVQASNHASNLMEGLRATPFQELARFPTCMVQVRGVDNEWKQPSAASEIEFILQEQVNQPPPKDSTEVFSKFQQNFFDKEEPIVPELDKQFTRYFIVLRDQEVNPAYITLITRVEWKAATIQAEQRAKMGNRSVELRTVISDPYFLGAPSTEAPE